MADYAKKTVAELQEILKSRSLPHSGKKAELVARLNEADTAAEENEDTAPAPQEESASAPTAQAPEPVTEPVAEAPAAAEPAPEPTQPEATDSAPANTDTAPATSVSYGLNLPGSDLDAELAKRKARAERFGVAVATNGESGDTQENAADTESQKALERAKRFGTGQATVGKLDEALSAEPERGSRKRPRTEDASALDDPGLRRGFAGRGRGGPRGGRFRGGRERDNSRRSGDRPAGVAKQGGVFSTEADRLAAEARRKKFATA